MYVLVCWCCWGMYFGNRKSTWSPSKNHLTFTSVTMKKIWENNTYGGVRWQSYMCIICLNSPFWSNKINLVTWPHSWHRKVKWEGLEIGGNHRVMLADSRRNKRSVISGTNGVTEIFRSRYIENVIIQYSCISERFRFTFT